MWPYWMLFAVPALMAVCMKPNRFALLRPDWGFGSWLFWLFLVLLIGLRHEVGGDWGSYLNRYDYSAGRNFLQILTWSDPSYVMINWLSYQVGLGIVGVNLISGAIFAAGLITFSRTLQRPWLALTVAVPYMVIVVAMGYVRQGVALGLVMAGLAALQRGSVIRYFLLVLIGASFHKSAVVMLPLAGLAFGRMRVGLLILAGLVSFAGFYWFLQDSIGSLGQNYLESEYTSSGALVRLSMSLMPALFFLLYRDIFELNFIQRRIWFWISIAVLVLFSAYFFIPSSTAIDRLAIYLMPIQIVVFSSLPDILNERLGVKRSAWLVFVIVYYASVQFVWIVFSDNAHLWLPYRFYFTEVF